MLEEGGRAGQDRLLSGAAALLLDLSERARGAAVYGEFDRGL